MRQVWAVALASRLLGGAAMPWTLPRLLRRLTAPDALLLLALAAVFALTAALLIWPELLGAALGRPRLG